MSQSKTEMLARNKICVNVMTLIQLIKPCLGYVFLSSILLSQFHINRTQLLPLQVVTNPLLVLFNNLAPVSFLDLKCPAQPVDFGSRGFR